MSNKRWVRELSKILITVAVTATATLLLTVGYFHGKVDAIQTSLGEYAIRESRAAAARAVDAVMKAEAAALESIEVTTDAAHGTIFDAQTDVLSTVADAHGIAADEQAVVRLNEYLNRRWCNRTGSRQLGTAYRNTTALPLEVAVTVGPVRSVGRAPERRAIVAVDNIAVVDDRGVGSRIGSSAFGGDSFLCSTTVTVPPAAAYAVRGSGRLITWHELSTSPCGDH